MTGRRKSGRKSGTSTKKDTPEKTRRSSRRRGHNKSDSEDDSASEQSADGAEQTPVTSQKQESQDSNKGGDESGGSDGAWQVRSENGGKGGIPKLKISLHRPSDTSSPSSEPLSSPGPRRSRRGGASPGSRNEEASEDGEDKRDTSASASENENERRASRTRVQQDSDESAEAARRLQAEEQEAKKKRDEEARLKVLEETKRKAEEAKLQAEKEEKARIEAERELEAARKADEKKLKKKLEEEKERKAEEEKEMKRKAEEEKEKKRKADIEMEKKRITAEEQEKKRAYEKELEKQRQAEEKKRNAEKIAEEAKKLAEKEEEMKRQAKEIKEREAEISSKKQEVDSKDEPMVEITIGDDVADEPTLKHRSPSRDSSEERAKVAALASRKQRKRQGSEDGELVDSPDTEIVFPVRTEGKIKTTGSSTTEQENKDAPIVRKRRWGSSGSQAAKKPPLAISTDVLKEIIPEVKPVALSEVELSPNKEEVEIAKSVDSRRGSGQSRQGAVASHRRRRSIPSDESEKDYEEEGVESGGEEMVRKEPPAVNHVTVEDDHANDEVTEVAMPPASALPPDPLEMLTKQRSPSPARHPVTNVLYITNLVRPFTVVQLRDLLARTGTITEDNGFWIDSIKSRCFVKYASEEDAKNTRHALHGVRWPASNPKQLNVDYGTEERMTNALEGGRPAGDAERRAALEERREREKERELRDQERRKEREERRREVEMKVGGDGEVQGREVRRVVDREPDRDRERDRDRNREKDDKPFRTVRKVTIPVREWDLGKAERGFSPPPPERFGDDREDRRKREKDRGRSNSPEPYRKIRKREEAPPKPLLDDIFRKTKATPCIYWHPLTDKQIAEKEAMRRKHIEEQEKKLAEDRKRRETKEKRRRTRSRTPKK